ncbi:MAG: 30S ribosomal protein S2 [Gammaproteobacteria bacterium]
MIQLKIKDMFEAGVHFGHLTRVWNPKMQEYIHGAQNQIHIINLDHTVRMFGQALDFIRKLSARGGKLMFVGTKPAARDVIVAAAKQTNMPYVDHRWLGGMLTNYKTIKQSIRRLKELETMKQTGVMDQLVKKEALTLQRQTDKLERALGGIKDMSGLPDAIFVIDVGLENIAVKEANRLGIPVIGVVDTNHGPEGIDYVIPGNDDSIRAIKYYVECVVAALQLGASEQRNNVSAKYQQEDFVEEATEGAEND